MGETRLANKLDHSLFRVKPRKQAFLDKSCKINMFTLEFFWRLHGCGLGAPECTRMTAK
jgi:hypothetical protein